MPNRKGHGNYDFGVTLDESVTPAEYNYRPAPGETGERPGENYLDLTPLGRQEEWEEPKGRADFARANVPSFEE